MPSSSLPNGWSTKKWTSTACGGPGGCGRTNRTSPPLSYGPVCSRLRIDKGWNLKMSLQHYHFDNLTNRLTNVSKVSHEMTFTGCLRNTANSQLVINLRVCTAKPHLSFDVRYLRSVTCDVTFGFEITSGCRSWLKNMSRLSYPSARTWANIRYSFIY